MATIKNVFDAHPEVVHYTTAAGLIGIVETQCLHATSIHFLNDREEQTAYFDRRFPELLRDWASRWGEVTIDIAAAAQSVRDVVLRSDDAYIVSFCGIASAPMPRGLLSQWRAYGKAGGYAISFDTRRLHELIQLENDMYGYSGLGFGDVQYGETAPSHSIHVETTQNEEAVLAAVQKWILSGNPGDLGPMYGPVLALSCFYKHSGFHEEQEVRIVAARHSPQFLAKLEQKPTHSPRPRKFKSVSSELVPYLDLFQKEVAEEKCRLPITSVIVGPHSEQKRRVYAVEQLLDQHGIEAKVMASDIPYVER